MQIIKKGLAIVLTLAIAFSTFAVCASAATMSTDYDSELAAMMADNYDKSLRFGSGDIGLENYDIVSQGKDWANYYKGNTRYNYIQYSSGKPVEIASKQTYNVPYGFTAKWEIFTKYAEAGTSEFCVGDLRFVTNYETRTLHLMYGETELAKFETGCEDKKSFANKYCFNEYTMKYIDGVITVTRLITGRDEETTASNTPITWTLPNGRPATEVPMPSTADFSAAKVVWKSSSEIGKCDYFTVPAPFISQYNGNIPTFSNPRLTGNIGYSSLQAFADFVDSVAFDFDEDKEAIATDVYNTLVANGSEGLVSALAPIGEKLDMLKGWDGTCATAYGGGSGSASNPYIIMNAEQLAYLAIKGVSSDAHFKLGADIIINRDVLDSNYNLKSGSFTNWPTSSTNLAGTFDGDGHTIYGYYSTSDNAGLFYNVTGQFKNVNIVDSYVSVMNRNHGIIGYKINGGTIENVLVEGLAGSYHDGAENGRGLMFGKGYGTFIGCMTKGKATVASNHQKSAQRVGAFMGKIDGTTSFTNCINYAEVSYASHAGGFVGYTSNQTTFTDCINYGDVSTGTVYAEASSHQWHSSAAGGFVGVSRGATVTFTRCANEGTINGDAYSGGLLGVALQYSSPQTIVNNSYNFGTVTCQATNGVDYHGDFIGRSYTGTATIDENSGAGDVAAYQSGAWLGDETSLWTIAAGKNPTLKNDLGADEDGHKHSFTTVTTPATCTDDGSIVSTCELCGKTTTEVIPATGHTYVDGKCECGATITYVAEVNGTKYETLLDAYNAVSAGGTIKMVGDSYAAGLTVNKDITIDLNGYAIVGNAAGDVFTLDGGNITINDSVGTGQVKSTYTKGKDDPTIIWSKNKNNKAIIYRGNFSIDSVVKTNPGTAFAANLEIYGGTFRHTSTQKNGLFSGSYTVTLYGGNFDDTTGTVADGYEYVKRDDGTYDVVSLTACDHQDTETSRTEATCTADGKITVACKACGTVISETVIKATGHTYVDGVCKCGDIDAKCTIQVGNKYYKTFAEAYAAAGEGDTIHLTETIVIDEDMDIANVTITADATADPAIRVVDGAKVTFENVNIDAAEYCVTLGASDFSSAGNLVIKSGTYHGNITAISVTKGNLVIEGGNFSADPYQGSYAYLINCIDSSYKNGTAKVSIRGGNFKNWNPKDNAAEGAGSDFCANGFEAVENDDGTYDVVLHVHDYVDGVCKCGEIDAKCTIKVGDKYFKTLEEAIAAAGEGDTIHLLDTAVIDEDVTIANVKIVAGSKADPAIRIVNDATVTFENVTIDAAEYCVTLGASDFSSAGNLVIKSGTYHGNITAISVTKGNLVIEGGSFSADPYQGSYAYLINCIDSSYANGTATVAIRGGNFKNWNPQDNAAEGEGSNFCAAGFDGVDKGDGTFGVIVHVHVYVDGVCKCGDIDAECTIQVGDKYYKTFAEAYAAAGENGTIHLLDTAVIDEDMDIANVTITADATADPAIRVVDGAKVTFEDVNIDAAEYCVTLGASDFSSAGNLVIKSGTYHGNITAISVTKGNLVIEGGNFSADPYQGSYAYLINCIDSSYANGTATVAIRGGNFKNWNPQDNAAEGEGSNFCAAGFDGVDNGNGTFGVIVHVHAYVDGVCKCGDIDAEFTIKVGDKYFKTLEEAIAAAGEGDTIHLTETIVIDEDMDIANVTITADATADPAIRVVDGAKVTFENVTMDTAEYCVTLGASDFSSAGNLVIKSGTYHGNITAISVTKGNLVIEGGNFSADPYQGSYAYLINCIDSSYANGTATVAIRGGNFKNWNPQDNAAEGENSNFCAAGYEAVENEDGTFGVIVHVQTGLAGSGTAEDPYQIGSVKDLIKFRDSVNAGETKYNASGVYVALTADIDLASVANWAPIGTWDYSFDGNFNGQGHKIMNLKISDNTAANGEAYLGFFGITANNTIENFVIENVSIESNGQIVAAAIAYPYYTTVKDITVCGDIAIKGGHYTAGVLAYTRLCQNASNLTVSGNAGSYITGTNVVGGVIADIQMNNGLVANYSNFKVSNITITGNKCVGGISGIIAAQTINGATVENVALNCTDSRVGTVSGSLGGASTISNVTVSNVTGATAIVGGLYDGGKAVQAVANDTYYATLEDALAATNAGDEITLLTPYVVEAGKEVTIDLAGKTITQSVACTKSYEMILNKGTLTINDSVGGGKISFTDTSAGDPNFGWGSYTIRNEGTLVVNGGTIEHKGAQAFATHMICAIFQYSGSTTINGGTFSTPNYRSIRLWKGDLTINGGAFDGQIWVQAVDNSAKLTINGGTFEPNGQDASSVFVSNATYDVAFAVTGGTFNGKIGANDASKVAGAVAGGKFTETAKSGTSAALISETATFGKLVDGYYTIEKAVASINGVGYLTLADAFAAAQDGDTIKLVSDIATSEAITNTKKVTLDLNGKTITGTDNATGSFAIITNKGELTITGNGKMTLTATNNRGWNAYSSVISNTVGGKLIVENGTIEHLGGTDMAYGIDNLTNGKGTYAETIINGGTIKSTYRAIRMFLNGVEADNILTVNGGTIEGANKSIWVQDPSKNANTGKITVAEGATLNGDVYLTATEGSTEWPVEVSIAASAVNGAVLTGNLPEGYMVTNVNGVYGAGKFAAAIGDMGYETLADAFAAAQDGDTIKVLGNIAVSDAITNTKKVTLDLNGKTITGTDNTTKSFAIITNKGELTITGNGKMTLTATNNRGWNAYSSVISNTVGGKLIVENGTIEHLGGTDMAYGIDNLTNGKGTYAETIINGGTIKSTYRAIRMFLNGVEAQNILTVNGGVIEGANKSIWVQDPSAKNNTGKITVAAGAVLNGDVYLYATAGSAEWPVEVSIAASAVKNEVITGNLPNGYILEKKSGNWTVNEYIAKVGDKYYKTFAEAYAAAEAGDTITVIQTAVIDEDMTIANVKIVAGSKADPAIRVVDGAKVTFEDVNIDAAEYCVTLGASDFSSAGNLVIKSGTYHGNITAISVTKGNLVIEGGNFSADPYQGSYAYLINCIDSSYANRTATVAIRGGNFENWNPQDNAAEGEGSNFCANGFEAVENEDGTYDVVLHVHVYVDGVCKCGDIDAKCTIQVGNKYYKTFAEAYAAAGEGDTIHLTETIVIDEDMDIANVTITADATADPAIRVVDGAKVTFENVTMDTAEYCVTLGASDFSSAGNLVIKSGTYHGNITAISVTKGNLVIEGGSFSADPYQGSYAYLINCIDSSYANRTATVAIRGGKFENWNPQDNAAEGTGSNFCAAGYEAVENEDGTFGVIVHVHAYVDGVCKCGEADPDYLETLAIQGFNVKFESDYSLYVYVPKTITDQYATVKVIASKAMYEGDTFVGYSDVELTEGISQGNYMLYEYAGFAAKEIASEIKAHIVAIDADGNEFYGSEKKYSLQSYALNKIKSESTAAKFRTMMVDFVNYGAAAQVYFSYNTTALANVGAEDYQNLATPTRAYEKHTANTADTSYATQINAFNLQFLNKVHIYGYVAINGQNIEDIKANWYGEATYVGADGKSQTQRIDLSDMFANSDCYLFSFNNLFSKEMSIPVTFTLYNAQGEQMSNAATYSIESYANSKGSGTDNLAKLTQALMSFGDAASAYFKK